MAPISPLGPTTPAAAPPQMPPKADQRLARIALYFFGRDPSPIQKRHIEDEINSWPEDLLNILAPAGHLEIQIVPRALESISWVPGTLILRQGPWNDDRLTFQILLEPLRRDLEKQSLEMRAEAERTSVRYNSGLLNPMDLRSFRGVIQRFQRHGIQYPVGDLLLAEVGLTQIATEGGSSTHQVRLRTTNPVFNRWVYGRIVDPLVPFDPGIKFYAGAFGAVATNPFAIVATAAWGVDSHLTLINQYNLELDTNVQLRVRSAEELPTDGLAIEITPHLTSPDRSMSLGVSIATVVFPQAGLRGSLVGSFFF